MVDATTTTGTDTTTTTATDTGAAVSTTDKAATTTDAGKTASTDATATDTTKTTDTTTATDWRAGLDGEAKEFATRFTTVADLAKAGVDLRKANGSMIRVPGSDAKPEEVAKFRKAIGAPENIEAATKLIDIGREPTEADKPVMAAVAKVFLDNGVPASAISAVTKAVHELAKSQEDERNRVAVAARTDNEAALKKELGADYDAHVTLAGRALTTFGDENLTALMNTVVNGAKLGDHPSIVKAFGKIGRSMGEGDFIGAVGTDQRASVQAQIDKIYTDNPPGTEKYASKAVQAELGRLFEQLHGNAPVVGRGRAA